MNERPEKSGATAGAQITDWQQRMLNERRDLMHKLNGLGRAVADKRPTISNDEHNMLVEQHTAMCNYLDVLTRRCQFYNLPLEFEYDRTEPQEVGGFDIDRDGPPEFE